MKTIAKVGAVAGLAVAIIVPLAPQAGAMTATESHATAAQGFSPVGKTPFTATSIASPSDGVAYVGGVDKDGKLRVQQYARARAGVTVHDIPVPAAETPLSGSVGLSAFGGHTYLVHPGAGLFEIGPKGLTPIALPDVAGPDKQRVTIRPDHVVADGPRSVWVAAGTYSMPRQVFHWDGHAWTATAARPVNPSASYGSMFVHDGYVFEFGGRAMSQRVWVDMWDGHEWQSPRDWAYGGNGDMSIGSTLTFAGLDDITAWGFTRPRSGSSQESKDLGFRGLCERFAEGWVQPCPAPKWGVGAAARLADGRVVLGGFDGTGDTAKAEGGFALVPRPGAEPVTVPGDPGDAALALAAPTKGTTVWALTKAGSDTTVQVAKG